MTKPWKNEDDLHHLARQELYTAVVGDIMDKSGLIHQFLPPELKPLRDDMIVFGKAMPVLERDWDANDPSLKDDPLHDKSFGLMLEALDDLKPAEVYLCTGSSPTYALWGELMSARAAKLGSTGAVVNGYSRDTRAILTMNFPVFSYGRFAQDQAPRGKVVDFRIPVKIGEVEISPGDYVFGDIDGVCIIPAGQSTDIFTLALEKARGEKRVLQEIKNGMGAKAAFEKYGIM